MQVATGNSPIVEAIEIAEKGTTGEIRVHLSRHWLERDCYRRAEKLFARFNMSRTTNRNAVLLYVNLRKRKFAVIGDVGIHKAVGQQYWNELVAALKEDLSKMKSENAIALAVATIGATLAKFFPADLDAENPNELPNEVTTD